MVDRRYRISRLAQGVRAGLLAAVLLGTAAAGLFLAGTSWVDIEAHAATTDDYVCNYPPIPDNATQSMTPNGRPLRAGSSPAFSPLILKTDNSDKRLAPADRPVLKSFVPIRLTKVAGAMCTSVSAVSSRLGRQFTLVGAKPSGIG